MPRAPTKATYLAFDEDPFSEFLFFLAAELAEPDPDELAAKLGNATLLRWYIYYARKAQRQQVAGDGDSGL